MNPLPPSTKASSPASCSGVIRSMLAYRISPSYSSSFGEREDVDVFGVLDRDAALAHHWDQCIGPLLRPMGARSPRKSSR